MKKVLLFLSVFLSSGLFCACSSDEESSSDDNDPYFTKTLTQLLPGDSITLVTLYCDIKAIYEPILYQDAPEWIRSIFDEEGKKSHSLCLYQGERDKENVYFLHTDLDATIGHFLNKEGKSFSVEIPYADFFLETTNWKLIYF